MTSHAGARSVAADPESPERPQAYHAADFVREQIRATVRDPAVADLLSPTDDPIGAKRICVDTDHYATFNRDNVELVALRATPIERFTADGLQTRKVHHALDSIVFATGYDAMTSALLRIVACAQGRHRGHRGDY